MSLRVEMIRMQNQLHNVILLAVLSVFIVAKEAFARVKDVQFERISIESGLSQSSVLCIFQDSQDFLWFGTYEGLNRYDGYNFKVYKSDPENPYSLNSNHIECITEDNLGMLWIGTEEGLSRFDRETEQFVNYKNDPDNPYSMSNDFVRSVYEDRKGVIWIGTYGGGLNRYDREKEQFVRYVHDPGDPNSLSHDNVLCIIEDSQGRLWVGTDGGLNCFDRENDKFIRYQNDPRNPHSISHNSVFRLYEDRSGRLWIGSWGGGLSLFDPLKNRFTRYVNNPDDPRSLSENTIRSIFEDRNGNLWIGTNGGGLNLFNPDSEGKGSGQFIHYLTNVNDPNSLSSNVVLAIFEDKFGILWIGTDFGGINKFNPGKSKFTRFRKKPDDPNGLNCDAIFSVYEDNQGIIWIGTNGGGLNRFDRQKNRFTHYVHDPQDPASLSNNGIRSICEDRYDRLWIATDFRLNRFDPVNRNFIKYFSDPDNPNSISHNNVWTLYKDRTGNLWAGTLDGLNRFDYKTGRFIRYLPDVNNSNSISDNFIWSIYEDSQNSYWIATNSGGLNRFDYKEGTFVNYMETSGDSSGFSDNKVLCIHEDRTGTLWFGTTKGLNKWNRETDTFSRFGVKDGLASNTIQSILEDGHGNLWIGTNNGLSKFDPKTGSVRNYSESEGLQSKEFGVNACCRLASGEMIFGGINGFNIFHPDSIKDNPDVPSVVITDFNVFNKPVLVGQEIHGQVVLEKSISECEKIELCYKDNVISFEFAALHYFSPDNNLYAYIMEGFEKEWNHTNADRRFASYTNLSPGKYVFRVRASNCDGIWNEKGASLAIVIHPPFWQTLWFRTFAVIFILAVVFGGYEWRIYNINKRRKELEHLVGVRTKDLQTTNEKLETSNRELEKANKEVQTQRDFLAKTAKELEISNEALTKSNEELQQFAYVASHDMQEPLRMVSSYVGLIGRRYADKLDKDGKEFIDFAVDGSKRMQVMINDLLKYSRVTTQGKPFEKTNMEKVLETVLLNLKIAIEESGTEITHDQLPEIMADRVQMERLLQNLLGNAIKYHGDRIPKVHVSVKRNKVEYEFSIQDNGIGIQEEYRGKIFGIFQRLHTREEYPGTGIGLAVCKKIVERHGGKIRVESKGEGKGSTFFFILPIFKNKNY